MRENSQPWVIFDADNTLWNVETLYDSARMQFGYKLAEYIRVHAKKYPDIDTSDEESAEVEGNNNDDFETIYMTFADRLEQQQSLEDQSLHDIFGYSASRFPRSFENIAVSSLGHKCLKDLNSSERKLICQLRQIAEQVFWERAPVYEDAVNSLKVARAKGYRLAIFTAGEKWVQQRRLEQSALVPFVDVVAIVEQKSEEELERFIRQNNIEAVNCWVIGDSLKSDISIANELGMKTIHINNPNWDGHAEGIYPKYEADCLEEAVGYLPNIDASDQLVAKRPTLEAHLVFEGGGAKGLAHIGALKAIEEAGIRPVRIAGSSAGALMAGLVAAGYQADDLLYLSADRESVESGIFTAAISDQIGDDHWNKLRKIANATRWGAIFRLAWWFFFKKKFVFFGKPQKLGISSLTKFIDWYDTHLRKGPYLQKKPAPTHRAITFQDFQNNGAEAPRITVSNLSNQTVNSYTWHQPDIPDLVGQGQINHTSVARVAAASSSIPIAFEPLRISTPGGSSSFVDGGMLSNLPAWAVDDGRSIREDRRPVIALALRENSECINSPETKDELAKRLLSTIIVGGRDLEVRNIERLHVIEIPTDASVLEFDMSNKKKCATFLEGWNAAHIALTDPKSDAAWQLVPREFMEMLLKVATDVVMETLKHFASDVLYNRLFVRNANPHIRANIFMENSLGTMRLLFSHNMEGDTDDDLEFKPNEGATSEARHTGSIVVTDCIEARYSYSSKFNMTKYQQALVRPSLKAIVSIPLKKTSGDEHCFAVLNFDSDDEIYEAFSEQKVRDVLEAIGEYVVETWKKFISERRNGNND